VGYENIGAIIMAAGLGKRMKSKLIKILHPICGQPMVSYVIDALDELGIKKRVIVLGHQREQVAEFLSNRNVEIAIQERPLGTGMRLNLRNGFLIGERITENRHSCPLFMIMSLSFQGIHP